MAWDSMHKVVGSNGQITQTPGYYTETITLGDDADSSTSHIPYPVKSDFTVLVKFNNDLLADTYVQVEHSVDGETWFKQGQFETGTPATDDISNDMAKIAAIDDSEITEANGIMMMYAVELHGMSKFTRFTVKANGQNEATAGTTATFHIMPHF